MRRRLAVALLLCLCAPAADAHADWLIVDAGNQPKVISVDVEDRQIAHGIGMGKVPSQFGQIGPAGMQGDSIPTLERRHRNGMLGLKLAKWAAADDPHLYSQGNVLIMRTSVASTLEYSALSLVNAYRQ